MKARPEPEVHWHEGMFLCPQHLQAFSRELSSRIARGDAAGRPGAHGLVRFSVDEEALARDVFQVVALDCVFEDGTLATFPETASVEPREFAELFTGATLDVFIGIPARKPNVPVVAGGGAGHARYSVEVSSTWDENERESPQELMFRHLQGRLFFGDESREGFESIRLAQLVRKGHPETHSALGDDYVPPLLAIGAWGPLTRELTRTVDTLRSEERDLAAKVPSMSALSSADRGADIAGFVKLQAVQRSLAGLEQVAGAPDLHPFEAYQWIVQAVANLAAFGPDKVLPRLPKYEHDDVGRCVNTALGAVRELIDVEVSVPYSTAGFAKDPQREGFFSCEIPEDWIARSPIVYLAVELDLPPEEVQVEVAQKVKLTSPSDVELVLTAVPGIGLTWAQNPPLAFPKRSGLHYFRVEDDPSAHVSWRKAAEERELMLLSALGTRVSAQFHLYAELLG